MIRDPKVQAIWDDTRKKIQQRRFPDDKKFIWEMDLDECLEKQLKYFDWIDKNPEHAERPTQDHLYQHYLFPRIEELTEQLS